MNDLRPRYRRSRWWIVRGSGRLRNNALAIGFVAVLVGIAAVQHQMRAGGYGAAPTPGPSQSISQGRIHVIDGDTISVGGRLIRLVGFNAPETYEPSCGNERNLSNRATRRLDELVSTSSLNLAMVPCSCAPGTEGTSSCNYGRSCGTLRANGRDVGSVLISEGLAVPFACSATNCPPMPRPWCN